MHKVVETIMILSFFHQVGVSAGFTFSSRSRRLNRLANLIGQGSGEGEELFGSLFHFCPMVHIVSGDTLVTMS